MGGMDSVDIGRINSADMGGIDSTDIEGKDGDDMDGIDSADIEGIDGADMNEIDSNDMDGIDRKYFLLLLVALLTVFATTFLYNITREMNQNFKVVF